MNLVTCTYDKHAKAILEIFNEVIANSTALYDYKPRELESMATWFNTKESGSFPVIGAIDDTGLLLGFASYGIFRAWPAYKYSVEHSIYIHHSYRGKGIGKLLLERLIIEASQQQIHVMIGGIDVKNSASIALHTKLGFTHAGTIQQAAYKFGRWLDLGLYQLTLDTPNHPVDG